MASKITKDVIEYRLNSKEVKKVLEAKCKLKAVEGIHKIT